MNRISKLDIQLIERYWINHDANKQRLKYDQWELSQRKTDVTTEKFLQNLAYIINAIDSLYTELDNDLKTIVDMRYWNESECENDWEDIADVLFMSRSKVLRQRNLLIKKTAEFIGWV